MNSRHDFATIYNRVLDVTACIHIPVKLFAVFVAVRYTPKNLLYHSYFILNVMFWNFLANLIFAFMHIYPLFPAECFRWDGLANLLVDSEGFSHVMLLAYYACVCNIGIALGIAFPYRYISFAHPKFAAKIKPLWVVIFAFFSHLYCTVYLIPLDLLWIVNYDDYPNKADLPERAFTFCFKPDGFLKLFAVSTYLTAVGICTTTITVFSILFIVKVRSENHAFHPRTVALQRKLFISLVITTAIAVLLGGIPVFFIVLATCFPHVPCSRFVVMVGIVIANNHGSIYAIAYLVLFKAYRDVIRQMLQKLGGKMRVWPVQKNVAESEMTVEPATHFHPTL